ncbi:hypothetical protein ZYGR_0AI07680 [Zygosaccharomyces rouxii]|uniref:Uncharacterized protein n=1 Tax=Zygosaccharomyces rouxii TaxID=4956 RepID=A0A1Q3ACI2_ZYGRO|nr:hypothetical protein ZYGR_0AI07680 [Zygosaccharomyces rouxii]
MSIDLNKDIENNFQGHLVPCKIRYTNPTSELKDFNDSHSIRGRVVEGKQVSESALLMEGGKPVAQGSLYNYEREGNLSRLTQEMEKWDDFLRVNNAIHM